MSLFLFFLPQIRYLIDGFKEFIKDFGNASKYIIDFVDSQGVSNVSISV